MGVDRTPRVLLDRRLLAAMAVFLAGTALPGCALRRSAVFLPAGEVQRIRVSAAADGRPMAEARVVEDPARVAQVCDFLKKHEEGWEPIWHTPWAGDYSIVLETDHSWQSIYLKEDAIQTNSQGAPVERKLSPASQQELLALLEVDDGPRTVSAAR
ncbi:MAG: hypothetical protein ACYC6Y_15860 [Thermoguttaceae bacterium]